MEPVFLGVAHFVFEELFFDLLVGKINETREALDIPKVEVQKWGDSVDLASEKYEALSGEQQHWVRRTELDFKTGEARQKVVLESIKQLAGSRGNRWTLKKMVTFLQDEYKAIAETFKDEIADLEGLADQNMVLSLLNSKNRLAEAKKKKLEQQQSLLENSQQPAPNTVDDKEEYSSADSDDEQMLMDLVNEFIGQDSDIDEKEPVVTNQQRKVLRLV